MKHTVSHILPASLVCLIATGYVLLILAQHQGDPLAFVRLGTRFTQGDPAGTIGYDGQFVYQIALSPWQAAPYIDIPAYRYQRILYPLLGRLLGLGQPTLIPYALILLNIIALTVSSHIMGLILTANNLSRWYSIIVGLFAGQLVSLRLDLTEPFSLMFALLGIYAFEKKQPRWAAFSLALSMFSKETAIAFVGGYLAYFWLTRNWRHLIETGLISLGPFAIWHLILWYRFGQLGMRSGGEGATSFSLIPFGGLLGFAEAGWGMFAIALLMLGPLIVIPCLLLTVKLSQQFYHWHLSPVGLALILHILMMITLPFSTYVDLPGVLRLTSGLVINTVAFAAITRQPRILNYSLLWLLAGLLLPFIG